MQIHKIAMAAAVLALFAPSFAFAQPRQAEVTNLPPRAAQKIASTTERLKANSGDRILKQNQMLTRTIERMLERAEREISRLGELADRIDSRIRKFEAQGKSLTEAKSLMVTARGKIDAAKTKLEAVRGSLSGTISTTTPATATTTQARPASLLAIRTAFKDVEGSIREIQKALVEVVKAIKGGPSSATTTPANP